MHLRDPRLGHPEHPPDLGEGHALVVVEDQDDLLPLAEPLDGPGEQVGWREAANLLGPLLSTPGARDADYRLPVPDAAVRATFDAPATPWAPGHRGVDLEATVGAQVLAPGAGVVYVAPGCGSEFPNSSSGALSGNAFGTRPFPRAGLDSLGRYGRLSVF